MKPLVLLLLILTSCAKTDFFYQGQRVAHFEGDMERSHFSMTVNSGQCRIEWDADKVDHSSATRANGAAVTSAIVAGGSAVTAGIMAAAVPGVP